MKLNKEYPKNETHKKEQMNGMMSLAPPEVDP